MCWNCSKKIFEVVATLIGLESPDIISRVIQSCGEILERWFHVSDEISFLKGVLRPCVPSERSKLFGNQIGLSSVFPTFSLCDGFEV